MKELIINGITVDFDDKTKMDLQFVSFLFTSINSISTPRSWTVSLPKTSTNLGLIEGADSSDYAGNFPYENYSVDYYNNGFRLINDGKGILTKIVNRIEFVFTFGKAFEAIKSMSEKKLTELEEIAGDSLTWNRSIDLNNIDDGIGWCDFYSFTNEDRSYTTHADVPFSVLHPTVTFNWLINKIANEFSLSFSGLTEALTNVVFPLKESVGVSSIGTSITDPISNTNAVNDLNFSDYSGFFDMTNVYTPVFTNLNITNSTVTVNLYLEGDNPFDILLTTLTYGSTIHAVLVGAVWVINNVFTFDLDSKTNSFYIQYFSTYTVTMIGTLQIETVNKVGYYNTSTTGGYFPVVPNLPDMSCSDFIFEAMQLVGLFPSISDETPTTIDFFSAEIIYDNLSLAKDWSNKLVKNTTRMSELSDVEFKFGNYARRNTLAYKKDETNLLATDAYLVVDNLNLEDESKLVELKFAAGKRFSTSDFIIDYPLYDIKIVSGELIKNAKTQSNDVISIVIGTGSINYLKFPNDLIWSNIKVEANYSAQQDLLNKPRFIKENFYLKPEDIYNFSTKIPIYLQQFGKYYAVMKLQYRESEFSECELLELKNI